MLDMRWTEDASWQCGLFVNHKIHFGVPDDFYEESGGVE
jgi:hypothetical protein